MMGSSTTTTKKTTTTVVKAVAIISSSSSSSSSSGGGGERERVEEEEDKLMISGTLHFIHHQYPSSSSIPPPHIINGGESSSSSTVVKGVTEIRGKIRGLRPGCLHALHIHSFGDTSNGCLSTGPHFNPHNKNHGSPTDLHRHAGDLGNIVAGPDGVADVAITDTQISLSGQHSILGRAVVVHANPDDLGKGGHELSKTTGNAGARIGCGIIGLQSVVYGAARI